MMDVSAQDLCQSYIHKESALIAVLSTLDTTLPTSRRSTFNMRIVIVGAGLGGMAATLSFLDHPDLAKLPIPRHHIRIFEAKKRPANAGAFIFLRPQAHNFLSAISPQHLGRLLSKAKKQECFMVIDKGLRSRFDLGEDFMYTTIYQEIYSSLLEACHDAGVSVEFEKDVIDVNESNDEAAVIFSDGTTVCADLVVGSDGCRSRVRQALFRELDKPDAARNFPVIQTGLFDILAIVPTAAISPFTELDGFSGCAIIKGRRGMILCTFVDAAHEWVGIVLQKKATLEQLEAWRHHTSEVKVNALEHFRDAFRDMSVVKCAFWNIPC